MHETNSCTVLCMSVTFLQRQVYRNLKLTDKATSGMVYMANPRQIPQ